MNGYAFIAHEDIEASKEWRDEVEAGLETMEVLVAVVEPGFKESDWCAQEVGYALGRKIDIIPLRAGLDPFGFFGKYQGIQIKGKYPEMSWKKIAGMRDILVHEYFGVDLELTWRVVIRDIPNLKKKILRIRKELK